MSSLIRPGREIPPMSPAFGLLPLFFIKSAAASIWQLSSSPAPASRQLRLSHRVNTGSAKAASSDTSASAGTAAARLSRYSSSRRAYAENLDIAATAAGSTRLSEGIISLRMKFLVYIVSALVLSVTYFRFLSAQQSRIRLFSQPISGRMIFPHTGGIPPAPRNDAPRQRLKISVSALSSALCATATLSIPQNRQRLSK